MQIGAILSKTNALGASLTELTTITLDLTSAQKKLGLEFSKNAKKMLSRIKLSAQVKLTHTDITSVKTQDKSVTKKSPKAGKTKKTKHVILAKNIKSASTTLAQGLGDLSALIDNNFGPVALKFGKIIGVDIVSSIKAWKTENAKLTSTIKTVLDAGVGFFNSVGSIAMALSDFMTVFNIVRNALPSSTTVFTQVGSAVRKVGSAFTFLGRILLGVGRMFLLNPIGLAVVAIAGAAYLIYDNWGVITKFFSDMWSGVTSIFSSTIDIIKTYLGWTPLGMILNNWGAITNFFSNMWSGVVNIFGSAWDGIKSSFNGVVAYIKSPFVTFFDWIASKFEWLTNTIGPIVDKVSNIGKGISDTAGEIGSSIGNVLKSASNFFKFGGDDESTANELKSEKKPANNKNFKMGDTVKKTLVATVATTQLLVAQPNINYATPSINSPAARQVQQNNHIRVVVNNPTSNVDVEKALVSAMNTTGTTEADRGLSDEIL